MTMIFLFISVRNGEGARGSGEIPTQCFYSSPYVTEKPGRRLFRDYAKFLFISVRDGEVGCRVHYHIVGIFIPSRRTTGKVHWQQSRGSS